MRNPNWRPDWLERWRIKIPEPLDVRRLSDIELRLEKETQELVEKALQERADIGMGTENDIIEAQENISMPEPTRAEVLEWARKKLDSLKIVQH